LEAPRIEEPSPYYSRNNEREGHRIEIDCPEEALAMNSLVEKHGKEKAQEERGSKENPSEHCQVTDIDLKTGISKKIKIIADPRESIIGKQLVPLAKRGNARPSNKPIYEHSNGDN